MIRIFHAIVESRFAPEDKDVIWLYNGVQYYWTNKGWEPIGLHSSGDTDSIVSSLDAIKIAIDNLPHEGGGGGSDPDAVKHIVVNGTEIAKSADGTVRISIPIKVSDLTNDAGYVTNNVVETKIAALAQTIQQQINTLQNSINNKQDRLISGLNIKTINNESLLGEGNIDIQGGGGGEDKSKFKSIIFRRYNGTPPTPTGGTYDNPVAADWSDGIPSGELTLWMSSRWFSKDPSFVSSWSTPSQATDTADIDFEWSSATNPPLPNIDASVWHNDAQPEDIWMAFRKKSNGIWGTWSRIKVKGERGPQGEPGEDGKDGTSVHILGTINSPDELPSTGNIGDSYIYSGPQITVRGKVWNTGDLIVWDGDSWESVGAIRGPKGESNYIFIAFSNDGGNTLTINDEGVQDGTKPGKYFGYCITTSSTRPMNASAYAPFMKFQGEDGFGYEFIYKLTATFNAPDVPESVDIDEYVPDGWNDDPSVSEELPYCWMVYRKKKIIDGVYKWGPYKGTSDGKANLYSKYSFDGSKGDSNYYLSLTNETASINCDENGNILPGAERPTCHYQLYYGKEPVNAVGGNPVYYELDVDATGITLNGITKEIVFAGGSSLEFDSDSVEIEITAKISNTIVATKIMTLTKNFPGEGGKPATNDWLVLSNNQVKVVTNALGVASLVPSTIFINTYRQVGDSVPEETTGRYRVTYSYDGGRETVISDLEQAFIPELGHDFATIRLYNEFNILKDYQTIQYLRDGVQGRQGAAVRGPVYWTNEVRRWCNGKETAMHPEDAYWIDVILVDGNYYVCKNSYDGSLSDTWEGVRQNWSLADGQFDFVATKLLLAQNAKITFLSSNEIYMMNGTEKAAGVSGGEYTFWAGAELPENANFYVKKDGTVVIKNGIFRGFTYQDYVKVSEYIQSSDSYYSININHNNYIVDSSLNRTADDKETRIVLPSPKDIRGFTFNFIIEPSINEHQTGDPRETEMVVRNIIFSSIGRNTPMEENYEFMFKCTTNTDELSTEVNNDAYIKLEATSGSIQFVSDGEYWVLTNSTSSFRGMVEGEERVTTAGGEHLIVAASGILDVARHYPDMYYSQTGHLVERLSTDRISRDNKVGYWELHFNRAIDLSHIVITPLYNLSTDYSTSEDGLCIVNYELPVYDSSDFRPNYELIGDTLKIYVMSTGERDCLSFPISFTIYTSSMNKPIPRVHKYEI